MGTTLIQRLTFYSWFDILFLYFRREHKINLRYINTILFLAAFYLFLRLPIDTVNNIFGTNITYVSEQVVSVNEPEFVFSELAEHDNDELKISAQKNIAQENPNEIPIQRISAYNPVPRQTDDDPNVSSCGPNRPNQIAVSRDMFFDDNGRKHLCGKIVTIFTDRGEVFRNYVIWDTMNPRYNNTIDIMIPSEDESLAFSFGVTSGVMVINN
jgi:hypothetical protein